MKGSPLHRRELSSPLGACRDSERRVQSQASRAASWRRRNWKSRQGLHLRGRWSWGKEPRMRPWGTSGKVRNPTPDRWTTGRGPHLGRGMSGQVKSRHGGWGGPTSGLRAAFPNFMSPFK